MTQYPGKIDTDVQIPAVHDNVTEIGAEVLNALREAVITMQTTLGINPQGTADDLVARLDRVLNADGTIKSTALPSTLVDLPLTNDDIGASAAIEESKLDLDFPTQTLRNQIVSNDTDIANLQRSLSDLLNRYIRHINGTGDRHTSAHITHTLADGYGAGIGSTVKTALDYLSGLVDAHRSATTGREHWASAIEYVPGQSVFGATSVITAQNVQDAIDQIVASLLETIEQHDDEAHSNGVSNDGYVVLNGQAAVNDASLQLTRYTPASGEQLMKIGHCNAAVIKTRDFKPGDISTSSNAVTFTVDIGTSTRTLAITGLEGAAYPSGTGRVTQLGIVDYLNNQFAINKFPLSAFAADDGEIVVQHNIARDDCAITVVTPGANSAIDALGLADIVGLKIGRVSNYSYRINGTRFIISISNAGNVRHRKK